MMTQPQQTSQMIDKNEGQSIRVSQIQKQLNILCCQHDSLMPLLQLNNYQNLLNKWQNSLKILNKKLSQYENKVTDYLSQNTKQSTNKYHQQLQQKSKQNNLIIKKKISQIQSQIQQIKKSTSSSSPNNTSLCTNHLINQLYQDPLDTNFNINKFKQQSDLSIKQLRKFTQMSLALFKNQVVLEEVSENTRLTQSRNLSQFSHGSEDIIEKIHQNIFGQLRKQLQAIRSGLDDYNLKDFFIYSFNRIKNQLYQINQNLQFMTLPLKQSTSSSFIINQHQQQILKQKLKLINWQIKGLKKKYINQINSKYLNCNDLSHINQQQKLFMKNIYQIQQIYGKYLSKFYSITNKKSI